MKNPPKNRKYSFSFRLMAVFVILAFSLNLIILPPKAQAQTILNLPIPGAMIPLSPAYTPAIVAGITIYPEDPLKFDFIIDVGDDQLEGQALKEESQKLISYFMATLTVPEDEMWVNLSPYEQDRIIADGLGNTVMGRDMLAQDYILKQLTASLMYPEDELGSAFWQRVYKKAQAKFGTTKIPTDTFNKIWIIPQEAVIYANGNNVFVADSRLKVMLESDYQAMNEGLGSRVQSLESELNPKPQTPNPKISLQVIREILIPATERPTKPSRDSSVPGSVTKQIIKEIIVPEIEREVNQGKNFANLRQIYHSMILATWYKNNLKESLLGQVYVDQNKVDGVDVEDKDVKNKIYDQYIEAFKKGVYNYIREDYDQATQQIIPRKYFSGGLGLENIAKASSPVDSIESGSWLDQRSSSPMVVVKTQNQLERSSSPIEPDAVRGTSEGNGTTNVKPNPLTKLAKTIIVTHIRPESFQDDYQKYVDNFENIMVIRFEDNESWRPEDYKLGSQKGNVQFHLNKKTGVFSPYLDEYGNSAVFVGSECFNCIRTSFVSAAKHWLKSSQHSRFTAFLPSEGIQTLPIGNEIHYPSLEENLLYIEEHGIGEWNKKQQTAPKVEINQTWEEIFYNNFRSEYFGLDDLRRSYPGLEVIIHITGREEVVFPGDAEAEKKTLVLDILRPNDPRLSINSDQQQDQSGRSSSPIDEARLSDDEKEALTPVFDSVEHFFDQIVSWETDHPESKIVTFVRHGESTSNLFHYTQSYDSFSPLTSHGEKQRNALAAFMSDRGVAFDRYISSDSERAFSTLEVTASDNDHTPEIYKRFREAPILPSIFGGVDRNIVDRIFPDSFYLFLADPLNFKMLDEYSATGFKKYAKRTFEEIIQGDNQRTIIATHGLTIILSVMELLGISYEKYLPVYEYLGNSTPHLGIAVFAYHPKQDKWQLLVKPDNTYLPTELQAKSEGEEKKQFERERFLRIADERLKEQKEGVTSNIADWFPGRWTLKQPTKEEVQLFFERHANSLPGQQGGTTDNAKLDASSPIEVSADQQIVLEGPKVSVIIPTYNMGDSIKDAINSVLDQTHQNFEIIIIDDASTDNTRDIVLELQSSDQRIKYFKLDTNQSRGGAINEALDRFNGDYVRILDADDHLPLDSLEKTVQFLEENQDVSFVYSSAAYQYNGVTKSIREADRLFTAEELADKSLLGPTVPVALGTLMYRREVFRNSDPSKDVRFNPKARRSQDVNLLFELVEKGHTAGALNEVTYFYEVAVHNVQKRILNRLRSMSTLISITQKYKKGFFNKFYYSARVIIISLFKIIWELFSNNKHQIGTAKIDSEEQRRAFSPVGEKDQGARSKDQDFTNDVRASSPLHFGNGKSDVENQAYEEAIDTAIDKFVEEQGINIDDLRKRISRIKDETQDPVERLRRYKEDIFTDNFMHKLHFSSDDFITLSRVFLEPVVSKDILEEIDLDGESQGETLKRIQSCGSSGCIVNTATVYLILERLGLDVKIVDSIEHLSLGLMIDTTEGATSIVLVDPFAQKSSEVFSLDEYFTASGKYFDLRKEKEGESFPRVFPVEELFKPTYSNLTFFDSPTLYAFFYNNLGKAAYLKKGQHDESIAFYQKAIELNPSFAKVHNNFGVAYANNGQYDQAITSYQTAIKLNPSYVEAHYNLGFAYFNNNQYDNAVLVYINAFKNGMDQTYLDELPEEGNVRSQVMAGLETEASSSPIVDEARDIGAPVPQRPSVPSLGDAGSLETGDHTANQDSSVGTQAQLEQSSSPIDGDVFNSEQPSDWELNKIKWKRGYHIVPMITKANYVKLSVKTPSRSRAKTSVKNLQMMGFENYFVNVKRSGKKLEISIRSKKENDEDFKQFVVTIIKVMIQGEGTAKYFLEYIEKNGVDHLNDAIEEVTSDSKIMNFSTNDADFMLHLASHKSKSKIPEGAIKVADAVIMETGYTRYEDTPIDSFINDLQTQDTTFLLLKHGKPVYYTDVPPAKQRSALGEKVGVILAGLSASAFLVLAMMSPSPLTIGLAVAVYSSVVMQLTLRAFRHYRWANILSPLLAISGFYTPASLRSAVTAKKIVEDIVPRMRAKSGRKPSILIEYGAGHSNIKFYIKNPKFREFVIAVHRRFNFPFLDEKFVDKIGEFRIDQKDLDLKIHDVGNFDQEAASSPVEVPAEDVFTEDKAQLSVPGGIDFNPNNLDLKEQGQTVDIDFLRYPNIQPNTVTGITPVIINIIPVQNIRLLLGLEPKARDEEYQVSSTS